MTEQIDSIVNIDDVLYPIHKIGGKYTMRYAGIDLYPTDDVKTLLAAFSGHRVHHYKSTQEFRAWYEGIIKILPNM